METIREEPEENYAEMENIYDTPAEIIDCTIDLDDLSDYTDSFDEFSYDKDLPFEPEISKNPNENYSFLKILSNCLIVFGYLSYAGHIIAIDLLFTDIHRNYYIRYTISYFSNISFYFMLFYTVCMFCIACAFLYRTKEQMKTFSDSTLCRFRWKIGLIGIILSNLAGILITRTVSSRWFIHFLLSSSSMCILHLILLYIYMKYVKESYYRLPLLLGTVGILVMVSGTYVTLFLLYFSEYLGSKIFVT